MNKPQPVLLTERVEPLSRWLEAFPAGRVAKPEARPDMAGATCVWLHLSQTKAAADQVRQTARLAAGAPLVVLTNMPAQAEGLVCLEAGAVGYVSALAVPEMLQQIDEVVRSGGLWVGPELLARLRTALSGKAAAKRQEEDRLAALSQREREVALAVAGGASNKEIARDMGITERTVKAHLTAIFERLNVRDRLQLSILVNGESTVAMEAVNQ